MTVHSYQDQDRVSSKNLFLGTVQVETRHHIARVGSTPGPRCRKKWMFVEQNEGQSLEERNLKGPRSAAGRPQLWATYAGGG